MSINKISKQVLFLLLAASLSITACKKDPIKDPQEPTQTKKLTKVTEDAANYSAFEYNTDGNLSKMTISSDEGGAPDITTVTYTYNAQKKPMELTISGIVNCKYIYTDNKITKMEWYSSNILGAYDVFTYTGDKISKIEKYFKNATAFELDSKSENTYYDNGNLKETRIYNAVATGQFELIAIRQYLQYDTKKSPFKTFGEANVGLFLDFLSINNIAKLKNQDANGVTELEIETTYTYDAAGYPLTSTAKTTENGATTTKTATFTYQ